MTYDTGRTKIKHSDATPAVIWDRRAGRCVHVTRGPLPAGPSSGPTPPWCRTHPGGPVQEARDWVTRNLFD